MKAWRLNEFDVYAAETLEDAVIAAMRDSGCDRDDVLDDMYGYQENESIAIPQDDGTEKTVSEILKDIHAPCFVYGYGD